MHAELSIWHLIATADPVVKFVMLLLLLASIWSWTIIFQRIGLFRKVHAALRWFNDSFWSGNDMSDIYRTLQAEPYKQSGSAKVFFAGFKTFLKVQDCADMQHTTKIDGLDRSMRAAVMRESDRLEHGLSMLSTIGAVSPYVGLFGTVWGIMGSFKALGGVEQATLSMVAPGISEALIATAMGLFAAIPAVIAYNRFSAQSERVLSECENFQDEFIAILQRQLHGAQHA